MASDCVLVFSGLDPSGAAGLVADVEVLSHFHLTPLSILTALTVQNTQTVASVEAVDAALIQQQYHYLLADIEVSVVKIGLLSSVAQIRQIAELVAGKTVVLDPIVRSSSADVFLDETLIDALKKYLLPHVAVLTPNVLELQTLAPNLTEQQAVKSLGCAWILLTRTDVSGAQIEHRLYHHAALIRRFYYQKLPHHYHGSGCTLSTAISALIARGEDVAEACQQALDYTYQTLLSAKKIGKNQYHPRRLIAKK